MLKTSWREHAKCAGVDTAVFMPDDDDPITIPRKAAALFYCDQCPVRQECLNYAYENNIMHGIYGGMTTKDRRKNKFRWRAEQIELKRNV
jgi:WhiB family redox-sensing transcriptional regulator